MCHMLLIGGFARHMSLILAHKSALRSHVAHNTTSTASAAIRPGPAPPCPTATGSGIYVTDG